jgi:hypothetical protein
MNSGEVSFAIDILRRAFKALWFSWRLIVA